MFGQATALLLRHRTVSAVVVVVSILLCALGVVWLGADFSVRSFFGRTDPEAAYLEGYLDRWGEDDMLVVVADGGAGGLLRRAPLERLDKLADALEEVEGVAKVISVTRMPRQSPGIAGVWIPVPLLASIPSDPPGGWGDAPPPWRARLLADPSLVPNFLSADGRYGAILVALDIDTADLSAVRPVVHEVERVVAEAEAQAGEGGALALHVAGVPAIRADVLDVIVTDQIVLTPVAAAAMGLLLLAMFRSRHGVLIPGIAAGVPTVMLLGIMGWTGQPFDLLNQSFLALVPAIAVANAIHLVSRYHEEGRRFVADGEELTPEQQVTAIVDATEHIGMACFLTTFTTVIGFLALLQTDLPVLRSYGVYSAVGVVISYVTLLTIVPLMLLWTRRGARRVDHDDHGAMGVVLRSAAWVTTRAPWAALVGAAVVGLTALWTGSWVVVDSFVTRTFDEAHETSIANHLLDDEMGGLLGLEFDLVGPPGAFERPEVIAQLDALDQRLRGEPAVRTTVSPATLLRSASVLIGGPDRAPQDAALIGRLYGVLSQGEMVRGLLSDGHDRARLVVRCRDIGAVAFLGLGERLSDEVRAGLGPLGVDAHLTGSSFVAYRGMSKVTTDLRNSLMTSFGVIGVVIALLFRDLWLGILSLIPNTLPQVFGYGVMGALGWMLEPAPAVVYTIAVGVSVDSAIHIIARFNEERRTGASVDDSVKAAIYSSGRAVMITELMLSFGFLVNVYSSSPANAAFGKLGAVIILLGPPSNLFVLPALLKLGVGGRVKGAA
jgi:predicted RND superfamily exporter protein